MRRLVVSVLTSLDGYYEGPAKDLSTMSFEDAFNTHNLSLLERAETMVYGGTWFAENLAYWAAVASDSSQSERDRRIAERVMTIDNVVLSDSFQTDPGAAWAEHTHVVSPSDAPAHIQQLKSGYGGDLIVFGSATTWNPLLEHGLVDELVVLIGAALLGGGSKMYSGNPADLHLLDANVLPDSELVQLRYKPKRAAH
jgi:dihydrofolate reductase